MKPTYVMWMSIKHNDGRRNSGVGRNVSMVHIQGPKEHHALCGREIMIPWSVRSEDVEKRKHCQRCKARWDFVMKVADAATRMNRSGDIAEHLGASETRVSEALDCIERSYASESKAAS